MYVRLIIPDWLNYSYKIYPLWSPAALYYLRGRTLSLQKRKFLPLDKPSYLIAHLHKQTSVLEVESLWEC